MIDASENKRFKEFMTIVDKYRTMGVRTNAETTEDAKLAGDRPTHNIIGGISSF